MEVGKRTIYSGRQGIVVAIHVRTMLIQRMDHWTKHRIPLFKCAECDEWDKKAKHDAIRMETTFGLKAKFKLKKVFNRKYLIDYTLQINNNNVPFHLSIMV